MWGLTQTHAVRFAGGRGQSFPLSRPTHGRPWWYGIGGGGERVLVWGAGALLEFDGSSFVPFEPDAMLDDSESVVSLVANALRISMLVCGDRMGAVARFDSSAWQPITEDQVIEGHARRSRRVARHLLRARPRGPRLEGRSRQAAPLEPPGAPSGLPHRGRHAAALLFDTRLRRRRSPREQRRRRQRGLGRSRVPRGARRGATRCGSSVWVSSTRRARPRGDAAGRDVGIIALSGANAWIWRNGAFTVLDMHEW